MTRSSLQPDDEDLATANARLRARLEDAEATIRAIRGGEVDAFLVSQGPDDDRVLVLDGVDRPYRLMIERMNQGAVTVLADGTIFYANRRFTELINRPAHELVGGSLAELIAKEDHPLLRKLLEDAARGDAEVELRMSRADGVQVPVHSSASSLLEQQGVISLIFTDLTQQKHHEAERARRVAAEAAAEVLREADRRKDEFLAMLAHELRGPLAPLRNGLAILNEISPRSPDAKDTRAMMSRQIDGLVRLVDDLLDVGRVTQGKIKLEVELTDLATVTARAVESCRPLIDQHGHSLEWVVPTVPLPVAADVVRAAQVIANLLTNAAKFTPRGGHVWVTVERSADGAGVVRVKDDGLGIEPGVLPKIFDLFVQADPTSTRSEGGLGIGLTLARRLAEMHGGTLTASSRGLGRGSEFELRIPLVQPAASTAAVGSAVQSRTAGDPSKVRRVLIVDDHGDSVQTLAYLLRLRGHEVREASDGLAAIEVAVDFEPDLVLLDIGLPGINGYETARRMRGYPRLGRTQIVALSGYGTEADRRRSGEAGFDDHFVKPVDFELLEKLLGGRGRVAAGGADA